MADEENDRDYSGDNGDDSPREERSSSSGGYRPSRPPRRRFGRRQRVCQFCAEKTTSLDYKQTDILRRYVTDQGKIRSRRETGTCAKHQRMMSRAVKRARHMALLPYTGGQGRS